MHQTWSSVICHILPIGLINLTSSIIHGALMLAIPLYAISEFPSTYTSITGIIITAIGGGNIISGLFIGRFISITSDEFCILFSMTVRTICLISLYFFSQDFYLWIFVSFMVGLSSMGAISTCVTHILAKHIQSKKRGKISSLIVGCSRFGRALGPLFVGFIDDLQISILICATISFLSFFIVCCVMLPPNIAITTHAANGSLKYFKDGWKQTKWKRMSIENWFQPQDVNKQNIGICYVWQKYAKLVLFYGLLGFGLSWVRKTRGLILTFRAKEVALSNADTGSINSISFILDSVFFIVTGYLMDKYGRKSTAIPGLTMFAVSLVAVNYVSDFEGLSLVAVMFGFADGITTGLLMTIVADLAPKECKSEFIAAFWLVNGLPQIVTPLAIGYMCMHVSLFSAAILSAVIGFVTMLWVAFVLEESAVRNQSREKTEKTSLDETELIEMSEMSEGKLSQLAI